MKGKFSFSPSREDFREKEKGIFVSTHLLYSMRQCQDEVKTYNEKSQMVERHTVRAQQDI
jgi:hypothetical protein